MKKILFDVREIEKNKPITGIGRFILSIIKNSNFFKEYQFILLGNKNTDFENVFLKEYERIIINDFIPLISEQLEIYKEIKKLKPDIYFSPYYKYPILTNLPVITSIFDITYLKISPYNISLKNKLYIKNFIKYFSPKCKLILTSSNTTKQDIISYFKINPEKIEVLYLPLDETFKPQSQKKINEVLNKFKINKNYILYVGNNNPHKNLKTLYKAYVSLEKEIRENYLLVFVGFKDIHKDYPQALILEKVNDEELKSLYSGCSLFVFPSFYEGFGYPPLEALACGAKVLSSNAPALVEILKDNVEYFNPYDLDMLKTKIENILKSKNSQKKVDLSIYDKNNFLINFKNIIDGII